MNRKVHLLLWLRRWHGRFGIAAAVFFLFLAATGIALNHTAQLQLAGYRIHAPWLVRWYGIKIENPTQGFAEAGTLLVYANGAWLLNDKVIAENVTQPLGMVKSEGILYIATRESLYIYSTDGLLVEKISSALLPAPPVLAVGTAQSLLILQTASGIYASSAGLDWKAVSPRGVRWSHAVPIASSAQARIAERLAPGISAETLLLDIHSGRIFGSYGPIAADVVALILALLGVSGVVVFFRSYRHHADMRRARD
jgi:hypothetical protein